MRGGFLGPKFVNLVIHFFFLSIWVLLSSINMVTFMGGGRNRKTTSAYIFLGSELNATFHELVFVVHRVLGRRFFCPWHFVPLGSGYRIAVTSIQWRCFSCFLISASIR